MPVSVSGNVPPVLFENARRGDWVAALTLSGGVLDATLIGADAARFSLAFEPTTGVATIIPAEVFDAERYGNGATWQFGLSVRTATGSADLPDTYRITLVGLDDTPP